MSINLKSAPPAPAEEYVAEEVQVEPPVEPPVEPHLSRDDRATQALRQGNMGLYRAILSEE